MFLQSNNHFFLPALSGCPVYWFLIQSWRMSSGTCWWRQKSSGFSTKGAHINSWWKCKLVQDFWRDSGSLYQETEKKIIPFHPVSLFLGIQLIDIIRDLVRNHCPKIITQSENKCIFMQHFSQHLMFLNYLCYEHVPQLLYLCIFFQS